MIRILSVLFTALVSVSAMATPKVGDYAAFNTTLTINGQSAQADVQQEILRFDESNNQYLERQVFKMDGQDEEVSESWKPADNYLDSATIETLLAHCGEAGGVAEEIAVAAGSFPTCAMKFDNDDSFGTVWIAQVPFGVAQVNSTNKENGLNVMMSLRSFR